MYKAVYDKDITGGRGIEIGQYSTLEEAAKKCRYHAEDNIFFEEILAEDYEDDGYDMAALIGTECRLYAVDKIKES